MAVQAKNRRKSHDSESCSSENSSNRIHQQQHQSTAASSSFMLSPASVRDLSTSGNSRLSAGSGNDNSSLGSTGALAGGGEVFITSTPKSDIELSSVIMRDHPSSYDSGISPSSRSTTVGGEHGGDGVSSSHYLSHKRLSGEDWRSSSQESSLYTSSNRVNAFALNTNQHPSSSSPRGPSSLTSSNNSLNQQLPFHSNALHAFNNHQSTPSASSSSNPANLNSNSNNINNAQNGNQLPPPIPNEPPPPITATERLDRLTMISSSNPVGDGPQHYDKPTLSVRNNIDRYNTISGNNQQHLENPSNNSTAEHPHSERRRSQGAVERLKGMPNQFQPPIPRSQPGSLSSSKQHSLDNSIVSGHNPSRPPSAHALSSNQNNPPQQRARPASVMGPSKHIRGVISRPPGGERRQQPQGQGGGNSNDVMRRNVNPHDVNQTNRAERPKSVPPHLFNKTEESDRRDIPVPPPRRTREPRDFIDNNSLGREEPDGREPSAEIPLQHGPTPVTLIREPSRRGSRPSDPSQSSPRPLSSHPASYQAPHHQSNNNPSLSNSRQSSSSSLSSSQNQTHPPNQRPQIRPDSLPLRGIHNGPLKQGHPYDGVMNSYRPMSSSTIPRSQSSIGNPISNQQQQHHQLSRSTTPGPHSSRRNLAGTQSQNPDSRDDPSAENFHAGQDSKYSHHSSRDPYTSAQGYDPRQSRGGSEPQDLTPSGPHQQSHNNSSHPSNVYPGHSQHHPPPHSSNSQRSHSQGPPTNRSHLPHHQQQPSYHHHQKHSGYTSSSGSSTNGPLSPGSHHSTPQPKSDSSDHLHNNSGNNSSNPPAHSTAPQLRSQGKMSTSSSFHPDLANQLHNNNNTTYRDRQPLSNSILVLRSPGEVIDAGSHPNQMKAPSQKQDGDAEGEALSAKAANSIWRPRWS